MRKYYVLILSLIYSVVSDAQVDTSFIYNTTRPYGLLDIRISKSATRYFYLREGSTFSFRESAPGVPTNTYMDKTAWDSSPYEQGQMREKNGTADDFILNYRLLHPEGYNEDYKPGYPIVLFMHGAGERGNCWEGKCYHADKYWKPAVNDPPAPTSPTSALLNNDHQLLHGGSNYLKARNIAGARLPNDPNLSAAAFPGFVLFPQMLNLWDATAAHNVIRLVRLIAKKYNIDENRIYITGLSHGGYGTYEVLKRAPWLFAAALPMSAPNDGGIFSYNLAPEVAHIPWWIFQGALDGSPPPSATEKRVKILRDAGAVVRYTKYANLGHGTWNSAFKEPDYFKWILSQDKSKIHVFAGSPYLCGGSADGVRLELAAGFKAYMWEKDGVVIAGATSNFYIVKAPGTYRARFSRVSNPAEGDWNAWSPPVAVTQSTPPPRPTLTQVGTVMLPDLNNNANARLKSQTKNEYYYWYKDGVKLSIYDTTSMPLITPSSGSGSYTVAVAQRINCQSPPSLPTSIFFNNEAPLNITSPLNLTAAPGVDNEVSLKWNDLSGNEKGFEIWRRKAFSSTSFSKWELVTISGPNASSYADRSIDPLSTYHYKIRAINSTGRSEYSPPGTAYVSVKTNDDKIKPSAPSNLVATMIGVNTIQLKWEKSTDNFGLRQYQIQYNNTVIVTKSTATTFTLADLAPNTYYNLKVSAEDLRGNISDPSNEVIADTYLNGLFYQHTTGAWTDLDDINWSFAEYRGKATTFTLAPRTQDDFFNFKFDGYLYINTPGDYQFQAISSDGSRLEIDGAVIVNNDGIHGSRTLTSPIQPWTAGPKRITVSYFEYDESHVLTIRYKGPDTNNAWIIIPASALKSGDKTASGRTSVVSTETSLDVQLYPNPATESDVNVKFLTDERITGRISLVDFTGQELYSTSFESVGASELKLAPPALEEGVYLLRIMVNGKIIQRRLSITRR
jgi:hypothetical protein